MRTLKVIWRGWQWVGKALGDFIARLVLSLLYFTLVLPFGLITRGTADPLSLQGRSPPTWLEREQSEASIDEARRLS